MVIIWYQLVDGIGQYCLYAYKEEFVVTPLTWAMTVDVTCFGESSRTVDLGCQLGFFEIANFKSKKEKVTLEHSNIREKV
jgi:hypothetical protein